MDKWSNYIMCSLGVHFREARVGLVPITQTIASIIVDTYTEFELELGQNDKL